LKLKCTFEHIEPPAKLLDHFLRSNKSNINQSWQTCGQRSGMAAGSKSRALAFCFSEIVICSWYRNIMEGNKFQVCACLRDLQKECGCAVATSDLKTCSAAKFVGFFRFLDRSRSNNKNKVPKIHVSTTHWCPRVMIVAEAFSLHPGFSWHSQNCHWCSLSIDCRTPTGRREPPSKEVPRQEGLQGALDHPPWGAVLKFSDRPFLDVGLRGSPDPATCEDCHRDQRHQPRLVTRSPGGPTGPRLDGGPAGGLIELEVSSLGESRLRHHQWCTQRAGWPSLTTFKGRFYRPVEPGDLQNKWEWTELIQIRI